MDPRLLNGFTGSILLVLLFLSSLASSLSAAPSGGQAVKVLRSVSFPAAPSVSRSESTSEELSVPLDESSEIAEFTSVDEPAVPAEEEPRMMDAVPQAEVVAVSAEASVVETAVRQVPIRPSSSTAAYLPLNGSLPLRFSAPKRWPAPLPAAVTDPVEIDAQAIASSGQSNPVVVDESVILGDTPPADAAIEQPAQEPSSNPSESAPVAVAGVPGESPVLTADLVLGYMNDLSANLTVHNERFLPALSDRSSSVGKAVRSQP